MLLVAAGTISSDGSVDEATFNVTVQKDATGRYLIDMAGVSYYFGNFVAVVTAVSDNLRSAHQ